MRQRVAPVNTIFLGTPQNKHMVALKLPCLWYNKRSNMNKTIGQLIKEDHWSTRRLAVSLNITEADLKGVKWEKSNKPYKKSKKQSYLW